MDRQCSRAVEKIVGPCRRHQAVQKSKLGIGGRLHVVLTFNHAPHSNGVFRCLDLYIKPLLEYCRGSAMPNGTPLTKPIQQSRCGRLYICSFHDRCPQNHCAILIRIAGGYQKKIRAGSSFKLPTRRSTDHPVVKPSISTMIHYF